jgi:photosystem II stability/assembly factor-like uncharacterized protein
MNHVLVATDSGVLVLEADGAALEPATGFDGRAPTCLALAPGGRRAFCGLRGGLLASDDGGVSWHDSGLSGKRITSVTVSPARPDVVWVGTEPSAIWRSQDGGATWQPTAPLEELRSSGGWSFPPRPETHHARWIGCHPVDPDRLWVAIEAGALIRTMDGGRSWLDRTEGGPYDTHELAVHPSRPEHLRVAAGDGYYESTDGGDSWATPEAGLEVDYLRSVAIDPGDTDVLVVSAASHPHAAYAAGRSDGRIFRRVGSAPWERVTDGWPSEPSTIAPLLRSGSEPGELWAADERGLHRSQDGGAGWRLVAPHATRPHFVMGLEVGAG